MPLEISEWNICEQVPRIEIILPLFSLFFAFFPGVPAVNKSIELHFLFLQIFFPG